MRALLSAPLQDRFGRRFPYLRLSITDVCNFRCSYCLPDGYACSDDDAAFLTVDEIRRVVRAFSSLGTTKVRLTGGEPTLRRDFTDVARAVADIEGIEKVAFTTNGFRLAERAQSFFDAGLSAINVSVDSLDPARFKSLTGHDRLAEVLAGIEAAIAAGFQSVKINAVLLRGINDGELDGFLALIEHRPISLRFIELMETGDNRAYFRAHHVSSAPIRDALLARGFSVRPRADDAGPALELVHPGYRGSVGLIAPYGRDFCATCNRLRISARGELHLCLFGEAGHDLRPLLARDGQLEALTERLRSLLQLKREGHFLHQGDVGARRHFASVGG